MGASGELPAEFQPELATKRSKTVDTIAIICRHRNTEEELHMLFAKFSERTLWGTSSVGCWRLYSSIAGHVSNARPRSATKFQAAF